MGVRQACLAPYLFDSLAIFLYHHVVCKEIVTVVWPNLQGDPLFSRRVPSHGLLCLLYLTATLMLNGATAVAQDQPVIILDPGHGGDDAGVAGPAGLTEKALSLDISLRIKRRIDEQLGLPAFLTRSEDKILSLNERASFANNHRGSLFISIHLGGFPGQLGEGISLFYFEAGAGEASPALAPLTVWVNQQDPHRESSRTLGAILGQSLGAVFPDGGEPELVGLPLYLLRAVEMPAVLMEPAVLTNPLAENALGREETLERIAQAIFEGIRLFVENRNAGRALD